MAKEDQRTQPAGVLTIAGSDSGGAAGLQADLKTFAALGVYGMSVVTVVTAQNSVEVAGVHFLPAEFVAQQMNTVLGDYRVAAVKTGFTGRAEIIAAIASRLREQAALHVVVDPVLVNHRGESMFPAQVATVYREQLFPLAHLITPNYKEAALLTGRPIDHIDDLALAAQDLLATGTRAVLVTGFPAGADIVDVFSQGGETHTFRQPRIPTGNLHGSGDTLSAAVAAYLAQGEGVLPAVTQARQFTRSAIVQAAGWRLCAGHGPLNQYTAGLLLI